LHEFQDLENAPGHAFAAPHGESSAGTPYRFARINEDMNGARFDERHAVEIDSDSRCHAYFWAKEVPAQVVDGGWIASPIRAT
jgi:hypothetical protein